MNGPEQTAIGSDVSGGVVTSEADRGEEEQDEQVPEPDDDESDVYYWDCEENETMVTTTVTNYETPDHPATYSAPVGIEYNLELLAIDATLVLDTLIFLLLLLLVIIIFTIFALFSLLFLLYFSIVQLL